MKTQFVSILALLIVCCNVPNVGAAGDEAAEPLVFPDSYKVVSVSNGGAITGVVKYEGDVLEMKKLDITKDVNVCGKTDKFDESLVVGEGNALQNTIVYLIDISEGADFPATDDQGKKTKYQIDQNGCQFNPHVMVVPVGQRLTMINSDGIMHNVHIFSGINKPYNKAQTKNRKRMPIPAVKKSEGPVPVKCDVHGWMAAWIVYFPHPYYSVTNEKGEYKITNVPPGTYKLAYWHEACGTNKEAPVSVTVSAGAAVTQDFSLTLKK
jgi:plastocyanin